MTTWQQALQFPDPGEYCGKDLPRSGSVDSLYWSQSLEFGLDFHWLHEVSGGVLDADTRHLLDNGTRCELSVRLTGEFVTETVTDENGGLRLTIRSARTVEPRIWVEMLAVSEALRATTVPEESLLTALSPESRTSGNCWMAAWGASNHFDSHRPRCESP